MKVELMTVHPGKTFLVVDNVRVVQFSREEMRRGNYVAWVRPDEEGKLSMSLYILPEVVLLEVEDSTLWIGETFIPTKPLWVRREIDEEK